MKRLDWKTVPIKALYDGLYDGPHATPKPSDSGPVFLGIKNVTDDGRLDLAEIRHIAEDDYAAWTRRVEPHPGDLVFTYEATLNRYALIPNGFRGCLGRRMALIRTDPRKVDVRFLLYYFFTEEWRAVIRKNMLTGATVDRIPLTSFPKFPVKAPPLSVQRRIAGVLSAYDELIENNQRRIQILETMARALYREWFVEFRFPGHENVPRVASSLGDIPEGWEVREMQEIADVIDCLHSKKPAECPDGPGVLLQLNNIGEAGKLDMRQRFCISASDYALWTSRIELQAGDCVITNVGRVGAIAQIPEGVKAAPGRNMTAVRPRAERLTHTYLIQYLLSSHMTSEVVRKTDLGTIMDSLNVKGIIRLRVPCPPLADMLRFESTARPMRKRVEVLVKQIHNLRRTRDLLLPRLLSGQVALTDTAA